MSSDKRINASRENGKLGGPKSDAGKARSSANALKHGLYSTRPPVLSTEDQAAFDSFRSQLIGCHQPRGAQESITVDQLVQTIWRVERYEVAQEYFLENEMAEQNHAIATNNPAGIPHDLRMSLALHHCISSQSSAFRELSRIIHRLHRTQQRLLDQLRALQGPRFNNGGPALEPVEETQPPTEENKKEGNEPSTAPAAPLPIV